MKIIRWTYDNSGLS